MVHRYILVTLLFFIVATLAGCAKKGTVANAECAGVHFCLNSLIDLQVKQSSESLASIDKYVYLNGKEEQKILKLDAAHWQAEFTAFREADIDKPALRGKYLVDTLFVHTDSLTRVSYIAQEPGLRMRYLHLYFLPGATVPTYLEARLEAKNVFYQSIQELEYSPNKFYSIKGFQDIWLLGKDSFAIKSNFID
jgi:hypothetical protein